MELPIDKCSRPSPAIQTIPVDTGRYRIRSNNLVVYRIWVIQPLCCVKARVRVPHKRFTETVDTVL